MKKLILQFSFLLLCISLQSQGGWNPTPINTTTQLNVGIGLTNPATRLHVSESVENDNAALTIENDFARPSIIFKKYANSQYFTNLSDVWWIYPQGISQQSNESKFRIVSLRNGSQTRFPFNILSSNGHIGIGTETPSCFLHISSSSVDENSALRIENDFARPSIIFSNNKLKYYPNVNTEWRIQPAGVSSNSTESLFQIVSSSQVYGQQFPFVIKESNGYLGLGTSLPKEKLHVIGNVLIGDKKPQGPFSDYSLAVYGKIVAKEVQVIADNSTNWADFVFKEGYYLRPLNDLEYFIKKNGHLPEIPSAEKIKEEGVNLLEMQKLQMQKIEELTLYIIKQQKEITALKKALIRKLK